MREILFRGKRKDNNEWVQGYYFKRVRNYAGFKTIEHCYIQYETRDEGFITYEVYPETVSQFTGLTDKNGKKIFEGDIVKSCEYDDVYFVKYFDNDNYSAFDCVPDVPLCECNGLSYLVNEEGCKVIGNIYDDKEILDVK